MGRVARAMVLHELVERTRDRWVLVISALFALLASAVSLYGRGAEAGAAHLVGPSLVTLASMLVPLIALVLGHDAVVGERERNTLGLLLSLPVNRLEVVAAKFLGRLLSLALAVGVGLGAAIATAPSGHAGVLAQLYLPTMLLGAAFLSVGVLVSTLTARQVTAATLTVAIWFLAVLFYDLGLLGLLVATDGGVSSATVSNLVVANPTGLFRLEMMQAFAASGQLNTLGVDAGLPGAGGIACIWSAWILGPVLLSGLALQRQKVAR